MPKPWVGCERREVKQGKSGGSVGTTDQGIGKGRSGETPMGTTAYGGKGQGKGNKNREGRLVQGGRGRTQGGERPMATTAFGRKGSKGRVVKRDRPVGAGSCRREQHTMASCQNPCLDAEAGGKLIGHNGWQGRMFALDQKPEGDRVQTAKRCALHKDATWNSPRHGCGLKATRTAAAC